MSGIDDLLAESNERWASARRRAQGLADNGLGEALKIYYTRYLPSGLLVLITLGTLGGMLVTRAAPSEWPSYLLFGWFFAAIGILIGGLTYNAKRVRPAAELGRTDVLLSLASQEQKQVRRQILGKAPLEPEHLIVARGACQWPIVSAHGRPAEMPAGGHENCPLMATRSAHQVFGGVGHVGVWV